MDILPALHEYVKTTKADVFLFSSTIEDGSADRFIQQLEALDTKSPRIHLFLTTFGGNPHSGYRIARALRRNYEHVCILIAGACKSAGTLITLAADELAFSRFGEIGPLDTQISKPDEIFSMHSGLDILQSMESITSAASTCFEQHLLGVLTKSGGSVSTKLAADIATQLTIGIMAPITAQIEPVRLGSAQRAIKIAEAYGRRLATSNKNVKPNAIATLTSEYPAHGFVIDMEEARELFGKVRAFTEQESNFLNEMPHLLRFQAEDVIINLAELAKKKEPSEAGEDDTPHEGATFAGENTDPSGELTESSATTDGSAAPREGEDDTGVSRRKRTPVN